MLLGVYRMPPVLPITALLCLFGLAPMVAADTAPARCDFYPSGSDAADTSQACTFSQRQGYINIRAADGTGYELSPVGDAPGNYHDAQGRPVYRESGLKQRGQIFRLPEGRLYVYWGAPGRDLSADQPFSTEDYDAVASIQCRRLGAQAWDSCPIGILRMEDKQASVVIREPTGNEVTVNFMRTYINAAQRRVRGELHEDTWWIVLDNALEYKVPLAAIEGG